MVTPQHSDHHVIALPDDEFGAVLGPSWSAMSPRQRYFYAISGALPDAQLDAIWDQAERGKEPRNDLFQLEELLVESLPPVSDL